MWDTQSSQPEMPDMILFYTLTANNRVLAIHTSEHEARDFAASWNAQSATGVWSASREAERIVSANRDDGAIRGRSDRFNVAKTITTFSI